MSQLFITPFVPAFNVAGLLSAGAKLRFDLTGTTTLATVYAEAALTTPLTNPVVADAAGRFPSIYLDPAAEYRVRLFTSLDVLIGEVDPYNVGDASEASAPLSVFDFIEDPEIQQAIKARTYAGDLSVQLQAAINAADGRKLILPAGKYPYATGLTIAKPLRVRLEGDYATYDSTGGTELSYTGVDAALTVGVADGNPDLTGPTRDFQARFIKFNTATGTTGLLVQNCAIFAIEDCNVHGFFGRSINLFGGNVLGVVRRNDIRGTGLNGSDGVFLDGYQFGNFVTKIEFNHIYGLNRACVFTEGRSLYVHGNTIETIIGCPFEFATAGFISLAQFTGNYGEGIRGPVFKGDTFTGTCLKFISRGNEWWGSGNASFPNGPFSTLPKQRFLEHEFEDDWILDATRNTVAALGEPTVYSTTSPFDPITTAALGNQVNQEYQDDLVRSMLGRNLLSAAQSSFGATTGAVAGTYPDIITGGAPNGWTNALTAGTWALRYDGLSGPSCFTAAAADFDACTATISLTPVNRIRYFALGFTARGWVAVAVNGVSLFDVGSNTPAYVTRVLLFDIPANAASFTLMFRRNTGNPLGLAEAGLYEIGVADRTDAGGLNSAITKAVLRLMQRGVY